MKRSHAVAFEKDIFFTRLPKECEAKILGYLRLTELCKSLSCCSKRTKGLVYDAKNWRRVCIRGMQNGCAVTLLRAHGRHFEKLKLDSMRVSRIFCNRLSSCTKLQVLDLRGIWKSSVVNDGFVTSISKLPLKRLLFGKNDIGNVGFQRLCKEFSGSLEELDFNSRTVDLRSFYHLAKLKRLNALTLRCCNRADHTIVPMLAVLKDLKTLQLSFLSQMSPLCVEEIVRTNLPLETLVLNGMYLNDYHMHQVNRIASLQQLSLCHHNMSSNVLRQLSLKNLRLLTIFCSKELDSFSFLRNLPRLTTLCLFRCSVSEQSLIEHARLFPLLNIKVHMIQGRLMHSEKTHTIDKKKLTACKNISYLNLHTKPYPFLYLNYFFRARVSTLPTAVPSPKRSICTFCTGPRLCGPSS